MDKIIYHGGIRIVISPAFGTGQQYNDFGLGFTVRNILSMLLNGLSDQEGTALSLLTL